MDFPKAATRKTTIALAFLAVLASFSATAARPAKVTRKEIERAIMCPCEDKCGKVLANCFCDYAEGLRREINRMIAQGMSRQQILAVFVKRYGPSVLAAPGGSNWFDLFAWISPFVALAIGALLVTRLVRRWAFSPPAPVPPPATPSESGAAGSPDASSYERRLEEELSRFEP
jgi:cytochrome c-type biogenesis protein CcmH